VSDRNFSASVECDGETVDETEKLPANATATQLKGALERMLRNLADQMDACPARQQAVRDMADAIRDHA